MKQSPPFQQSLRRKFVAGTAVIKAIFERENKRYFKGRNL